MKRHHFWVRGGDWEGKGAPARHAGEWREGSKLWELRVLWKKGESPNQKTHQPSLPKRVSSIY